jgi:hypothetical protein
MNDKAPLLLLGVALCCAIFAAIDLDEKGRSGFAGFLLGLFLGPIGVAVALLIPPESARAAE